MPKLPRSNILVSVTLYSKKKQDFGIKMNVQMVYNWCAKLAMNCTRIGVHNILTTYPYCNIPTRTVRICAENSLSTTLSVTKSLSTINIQNPVHVHLSGGQRHLSYNNIMPLFHIMRLFLLFYSPAIVVRVPHIHNVLYFSFLLVHTTTTTIWKPMSGTFSGEYDQFGMIKLRFTAPGSAGYVHIPQGVTVFHKSLATRRPRVCIHIAAATTIHTLYTLLIVADVFTLARRSDPIVRRYIRTSPTRILCKHRLTTPPRYSPVILYRTHAQDASLYHVQGFYMDFTPPG
uniref:Uncharacterized protein n=1 Tax=Schizaphis graminum TaxID=13262 RepID=A0A2S2P574_SCHGA